MTFEMLGDAARRQTQLGGECKHTLMVPETACDELVSQQTGWLSEVQAAPSARPVETLAHWLSL